MQFVIQGRSVDDRIHINKNQAIGPDRDGGAVVIHGFNVAKTLMHVFHETKDFDGSAISNLFVVLFNEEKDLSHFTIQFFLRARFRTKIFQQEVRDRLYDRLNFYFFFRYQAFCFPENSDRS